MGNEGLGTCKSLRPSSYGLALSYIANSEGIPSHLTLAYSTLKPWIYTSSTSYRPALHRLVSFLMPDLHWQNLRLVPLLTGV